MADSFWHAGSWLPIGMMIVMLVVALLVCGRGVRRFAGGACCGGSQGSAEDVLKHRYAKGEMTKEEFERVRRDLGGAQA